jgi:ribosome-binding protein aMBF1 (putative translation factor)
MSNVLCCDFHDGKMDADTGHKIIIDQEELACCEGCFQGTVKLITHRSVRSRKPKAEKPKGGRPKGSKNRAPEAPKEEAPASV